MSIPAICSQLLVTQVSDENHHRAYVTAYEKKEGQWFRVFGPFDAVIGKHGIAKDKKEGDGKSPSGLYPLLAVFGIEEHRTKSMPFILIHEHLEAVDDPNSQYYNQIVDQRAVETIDWHSSERMQEIGFLYEIGVVVGYNSPNPIPGKGSCIFLHIYRSLDQGTAGCTAFSFEDMQTISKWLNQDSSPHILQTTEP